MRWTAASAHFIHQETEAPRGEGIYPCDSREGGQGQEGSQTWQGRGHLLEIPWLCHLAALQWNPHASMDDALEGPQPSEPQFRCP